MNDRGGVEVGITDESCRAQVSQSVVKRAVLTGSPGFTLIEMLVVLVIIGLIMGLVGPQVLNYLTNARTKAARLQIEAFSSSLDLYYLDTGRYPQGNEGLDALVHRPSGLEVWNGPYIKGGTVPVDPWGHPYLYRAPAERAPYEITSLGSDGVEGGTGSAADIKSGSH
jgi:general secretion pathway protein G